jgi:XTP/dITP diphosphohydrolase
MNKGPWVFATRNAHKVQEVSWIIGGVIPLKSLEEVGYTSITEEPFSTLEENALHKAQVVWEALHLPVIAEDTGLEVTALGGDPGVHTARFAGPQATAHQNMLLLLTKLANVTDRSARFRTILVAIDENGPHYFEGIIQGHIAKEISLQIHGFGYDPVFIPTGYEQTFAELDPQIKSQVSHRAIALMKWKAWCEHAS